MRAPPHQPQYAQAPEPRPHRSAARWVILAVVIALGLASWLAWLGVVAWVLIFRN
ncbi:MAG: hypothetical protein ACREJC_02215 [Tepidisphaeraceae bacterium]